ncbi:exopolyphosphatase [Crenothrix polyspora]|uniref:Exopolyphosphatase n=1 Tax=Crenothrix polyspora TaxID=360316 RepID=A0A1R4HJH5_9GAMM|nr:exopolyphosphatase [Crenothrix polyspora]SJM96382.1 Exopolyphosphatase [Crenothrix polyspora]
MPKKVPEIVAAVDLGSNSFHMIICSYHNGSLQIIDRLKEMVRLAAGLDKKNLLDIKTQERALSCLERFSQRLRDVPPGNVRVVGTNTLRTAKNAPQFLLLAEQALNHPIHIISGIEEARLIYMGVAYSLGGNGNKRFVMDIGGGSTECIIGTGNTPLKKESLNMGCVSMSNQFFKDGRLSKSAFTQATLFAEQRLEPFEKDYHSKHWQEAIGASGSLRSIAKVLQAKNWSNNGITRDGLEQLVAYMSQCNHVNELNLPELDDERLPVFVGGVAIVYAVFKSLKIEQMTISDGALREGLVLDLLGRLYDDDIRSTTVNALAERYHTDQEHAARIQQTIANMLTQLGIDTPLFTNNTVVQFLNWAAALHEIGMDIAHSQYHKHSAYIIENGDLAGFSSQDQKILATVVKAHRRKFSKTNFSDLPTPWDEQGIFLSVILRLAVVLHRNRYEHTLLDFKVNLVKNKIRLHFSKDYLLQLPLTHADLIQEADYLKSAGFKLEFS